MKKSFAEIFRDALSVYLNSFLGIFILYACFSAVSFVLGFTIGKDILADLPKVYNPDLADELPMGKISLFLFCFSALSGFVGLWTTVIFKNTALAGISLVKLSFFEVFRKIWKIVVFGIILLACFTLITVLSSLVFGKWSFIILLPFIVFLMPLIYTSSFGIICQEEGFFRTLIDSVTLGYRNWGRIFIMAIGYMIALFAAMLIIVSIQALITRVLQLVILGTIIGIVFNFLVQTFSSCFLTVFYLNLSCLTGREPQDEEDPLEELIQND